MKTKLALLFFSICLLTTVGMRPREPILGGPCEGCENVFVDIPSDLSWSARIAPKDETGEPLIIEGSVKNLDGTPAAGITVYAYQTNAAGIYPSGKTRHGSLRGWALTDETGRYRFLTIRPGSYPGTNNPQHVHMHVIEPDKGTYYIDDILFDDDPLLTSRQRRLHQRLRGGDGICRPSQDEEGTWTVQRDILLGKNIPGY